MVCRVWVSVCTLTVRYLLIGRHGGFMQEATSVLDILLVCIMILNNNYYD